MPSSLASALLVIAIAANILPPGYPAYIGVYIAKVAGLLALLGYGWRERAAFSRPTSLAILAVILLVGGFLPFVYRGPQYLLAPVLIPPMLTTVALGVLARPAKWLPNPTVFALICLIGSLIALSAMPTNTSCSVSTGRHWAIIHPLCIANPLCIASGHVRWPWWRARRNGVISFCLE